MPLHPALEAALETPAPLVFLAVKIVLPGGTLRLLDGSGTIDLGGGEVYVGGDPDLGVLASVETLSDGIAADAPTLRLVINPPTNTAAATLAAADAQGGAVTVYVGALDPTTFAVQGDPYPIFVGEIDVPTLDVDRGSRTVTLDCVSIWERFFDDDEGVRLTDNWHQSVWPGELGLQYVTEVTRQLPWGQDAPVPAVVTQAGTTAVGQPNSTWGSGPGGGFGGIWPGSLGV